MSDFCTRIGWPGTHMVGTYWSSAGKLPFLKTYSRQVLPTFPSPTTVTFRRWMSSSTGSAMLAPAGGRRRSQSDSEPQVRGHESMSRPVTLDKPVSQIDPVTPRPEDRCRRLAPRPTDESYRWTVSRRPAHTKKKLQNDFPRLTTNDRSHTDL